jgi:ABC-2 type transport system ATP-binding protein
MILELDSVRKSYGRFEALAGLSVSVAPGAVGLLGPNGAGKSTLIKALLGLVELTSGRAKVLGLDVRREASAIRERIGYMPEDDCNLAGLPGVQSVALAGELAGLPARTALRRAHEILDLVWLAEERYRPVETYSTGMRQRIKLAQALIHAPKLVFLDEPTDGLDPAGRVRMLRLIRSLVDKHGLSVVLSTHILSDVEQICDAALILGRGRLLMYDTIARLQESVEPGLRLRTAGEIQPLVETLAAAGHRVEARGPELAFLHGHGDLAAAVLFAAQRSGVSLRELAKSRNSLEDIYLEAVRATSEPAPSSPPKPAPAQSPAP